MQNTSVSTYSEVERSGIYICGTCEDNQEVLRKGEDAPSCCNCHRPVTWLFYRPLAPRQIGFIPAW
jgi:hypothetical protein